MHRGSVRTVSFNADGDILVSGSDDRQVILWNWETGSVKLSFSSGHTNNVFQAKFMPFSDDHSIVTCAADGQVRHAKILESGVETSLLGGHQGQAHKLAIEPGSPFSFYSCGSDGVVKHFDLRTRVATNLFTCKEARLKLVVYLHAIAVDPRNPNLFAVGGMDEYARVYDIRSYRSDGWYNFGQPVEHFCPLHLIGDEQIGITGLTFSHQSELLVSYSDEIIYLFTHDMGLGTNPHSPPSVDENDSDVANYRRASPRVYKGHSNRAAVKDVNFFGPKSEYVVSGSDCGRLFIWRKKDSELIRAMEADAHVVNCVDSHPHMPLLCSSGTETDIKIWTPEGSEKTTLLENTSLASIHGRSSRFLLAGSSDEEDEDNYLYSPPGFYVDDNDDEGSDESSYDDDDDDDNDGDDGTDVVSGQ
ncbi:PREDICTED: DDB1- and CUL4-associated factor 8 isoform X2 [Tarenaya hassleriana]|nr:PREDICTED: DDB1- and CUL4-associated factor 8 isoform X2 [Tarenaya hassleriana]XP_010555204.1 PREDICTED: DDB1- and CUL4-associated factor 8 isoform X2 [Tarenaya hassleriana]XP_010555205.1 PREDICTED: DDB1- and CUL4-associated factor 8 isoform X2 [Tarenaya hassleriana]